MIQTLSKDISKEEAGAELRFLHALIDPEAFQAKFMIVLDMNHVGARTMLWSLTTALHVAERFGLLPRVISELDAMQTFTTGNFWELIQRYLTLNIFEREFPDLAEALPEEPVFEGKNPDWTLIRADGSRFHVETSATSTARTLADLNTLHGRLPDAKIIRSTRFPIYFELLFEGDPRLVPVPAITKAIIDAAHQELPTQFRVGDCRVMVDSLAARYERPAIISDEFNDMTLMKSTTLNRGKIAYTLATKITLKDVETKIDEKKKANSLHKIGNVWLTLFVGEAFDEATKDGETSQRLQQRVDRSSWLDGLILVSLQHGPDFHWRLRYKTWRKSA